MKNLKLGRDVGADETGLDAVPRAASRDQLGSAPLPFHGYDLWNGYEVSYLGHDGKPHVWHLQIRYDAASPFIVESKSLKLFLNSFNQKRFTDRAEFSNEVLRALEATLGTSVDLVFFDRDRSPERRKLPGTCVDGLELTGPVNGYDANLLHAQPGEGTFDLHSHVLRSNCPVTNQPDWGAVWIRGRGNHHPDPASLLTYLVSFREHQDFHEACCETIYMDLHRTLKPQALAVSCFYTRRGGLDINPHRFSEPPNEVIRDLVWRQ
ncbi:hypothetical protein [Sulfidibacter corallicola]|uniref:NADPH-dependent 7-cyano-7-deazaguanine reductase QueF n=1 Tax=Sulfidibacter corallicola TaxID=2818388 RepID=A0A8A4TRI1_SULCO|nr:hypothetical protein [Sulfidibacter corallicola]QTD52579.1 NADPH-dependent 7-cyano-7-deazaguanine reductase QueF [Sulfidibacter corallicola]